MLLVFRLLSWDFPFLAQGQGHIQFRIQGAMAIIQIKETVSVLLYFIGRLKPGK